MVGDEMPENPALTGIKELIGQCGRCDFLGHISRKIGLFCR